MVDSTALLSEITGRPVAADDAHAVAEHVLACLTHVTNARPLFGVIHRPTGALQWTAGGADFHDVLDTVDKGRDTSAITSFSGLMSRLGLQGRDIARFNQQMHDLPPGASMTLLKPVESADGRTCRVVMRHREEPEKDVVQFTLLDITPFRETARRIQAMARGLLDALDHASENHVSTRAKFESVLERLPALFAMTEDEQIARLARELSDEAAQVIQHMVDLLRSLEENNDALHWQPRDMDPRLRPNIPVHSAPVEDWESLTAEILDNGPDGPAIHGISLEALRNAYQFVRYSVVTMMISPQPGKIFALNGKAAGRSFHDVESFVAALGVEDNSRQTAVQFFEKLGDRPALGLFSVGGENVEAWGRPGLYGGWQAMLSRAPGQHVDVRGLFHALKNLLLQLQVLYVVKNVGDVHDIRDGLEIAAGKIHRRLEELETIARTGRREKGHVYENVGYWLAAAKFVEAEYPGHVHIRADDLPPTTVRAVPGEMEAVITELVRNAFQHGAANVDVAAKRVGDHLRIDVTDDGAGLDDGKLRQMRRVVATRNFDPTLTTRKDGTGNGILFAANAVLRFIDGRLDIDHGPDGRGAHVTVSFMLDGS